MNLDKRSKIIIGFIVAALVILIWQLSLLFGSGGSRTSSLSKSAMNTSMKEMKEAANPTEVLSKRNEETAQTLAENVKDTSGMNVSANQQKYLQLVGEYQMLEIQKMIAQDQAQIAQSRVATAEALAKIGQSGGMNPGDISVGSTDVSSDYELIYTGEDDGEWTATLKKNGQFNDVTTGSVLPDGAKILSVDNNGVVIQVNNLKKLVTFNGVTPFDEHVKPLQLAPVKTETKIEAPKPKEETTKPIEDIQKEVVAKAVVPVPAKVEPAVVPKVVATNVTAGMDISKADKNAYTIQVVADNSLDTINDFIKEHKLSDHAQAVKIMRNKKPWYIGVYGVYKTAAEAQNAIDDLPDAVQDEEPFVKRVSDVQLKMEK